MLGDLGGTVLISNELPRLIDSAGALAGRLILLRLTRTFYGREDTTLFEKLIAELPGILLWTIAGWQRLHERGRFVQPATGLDLVEEMENLSSPVGEFLKDRCIVEPGRDRPPSPPGPLHAGRVNTTNRKELLVSKKKPKDSWTQLENRFEAMLADHVRDATGQVERANAAIVDANRAYEQARETLLDAAGRIPGLAEALETLERAAEEGELARLQVQLRKEQLRRARQRLKHFHAARARAAREVCLECGATPVLARVRIESPTIIPSGSQARATYWLCRSCAAEITRDLTDRTREQFQVSPHTAPIPSSPKRSPKRSATRRARE